MKKIIILSVLLLISFTNIYAEFQEIGNYVVNGVHEVVANGNIMYAAIFGRTLYTFNISNPAEPELICENCSATHLRGIKYQNGYIYGANGGTFALINVFNPESTYVDTTINLRGSHGVCIDQNYIYVANESNGISILDINDLSLIGVNENTQDSKNLFRRGDFLYVADLSSMKIFNVEDPTNPIYVNEFRTNGFILNVYVDENNVAYVSDTQNGLYILNVNDPENIEEINYIDIFCSDIVYYNGIIFTSSRDRVNVIDINDPENPEIIDYCEVPAEGYINRNHDKLFIGSFNSGIRIIDASDYIEEVEDSVIVDSSYIHKFSNVDTSNVSKPKPEYNPEIVFNPNEINFNLVYINSQEVREISIFNIGVDTLFIDSIYIENNVDIFNILIPNYIIPPNDFEIMYIIFEPNNVEEYFDNLIIDSNDPVHPLYRIFLQGIGIDRRNDCDDTAFNEKISSNDINVYPNPFNKSFTIQSDKPTEINLYDISGRKILQKYINGYCVFNEYLPAGSYYLVNDKKEMLILNKVK